MEVNMLQMKSTKITSLLILVGLMILPVFLAACETNPDPAAVPFGLRTSATDDLVGDGIDDASEVTGSTTGDLVDAPVEEDTETATGVVAPRVNNYGGQSRIADRSEHIFDPNTAAALSTVEMEGLTYMREEEKLARDVYLALYDQWGVPVFQNIAGSEQAHMDSVLMLLDQYGLADPAAGKDAGEFTNPHFQSLYEQLVGQGSLTLSEALKVGATIEELDIVDLEQRLAQTGNEYIIRVYTNLLAGSENHLRAFVSNLQRQTGEVFQPAYLDQDAYQAIIGGAAGQGGGNGRYGGGNGRGGNAGNGNAGNGNGRRNGQGRNNT
jgi:hypothetical protein